MRIEFHADGQFLSADLREHAEMLLRSAFRQFACRVRGVRIYLWDAIGPRGGTDRGVRLIVEMIPSGEVLVREVGASEFAAVAAAVARARRAVGEELRRRWRRKRREAQRGRAARHHTTAMSLIKVGLIEESRRVMKRSPPATVETKGTVPLFTEPDRARLRRLIDAYRPYAYANRDTLDALEAELLRGRVVPPGAVPANVVTMNSNVPHSRPRNGQGRDVHDRVPRDGRPGARADVGPQPRRYCGPRPPCRGRRRGAVPPLDAADPDRGGRLAAGTRREV